MNILIVGGGMYVSGRGTETFGTVFPALFEANKLNLITEVCLLTTSKKSAENSKKRFNKLKKLTNSNLIIKIFTNFNKKNDPLLQSIKLFKPDLAIIAVPDHLHKTISLKIIKNTIHCLIVDLDLRFQKIMRLLKIILLNGIINMIGWICGA